MIELIKGLPDNVLGVDCLGYITKDDYERVLIPTVEAKLKQYDKVRLYYRAGPEFKGMDAGAMFDDAWIGFSHLSRWERVCVVTNVDWIRFSLRAFAFLLPCPVKQFDIGQESEAKAWIKQ